MNTIHKSPWFNTFLPDNHNPLPCFAGYHLWYFSTGNDYNEQLDKLHSLLYSFSAETWYDPWKKFAGIKINSPHLQPETKIMLKEIILKGGGVSEKVIGLPISIDETTNTPGIHCEVKKANGIEVVITIAHKTELEFRDSIEAKVQVDLFGNNKAILPERNESIISKGRIYF